MKKTSLHTVFTLMVIFTVIALFLVFIILTGNTANPHNVIHTVFHRHHDGNSPRAPAIPRPSGQNIITARTHSLSEREISARFQHRQELVQSACNRHFNFSAAYNEMPLTESRKKNIKKYSIYLCHIRKVASTTLIHTFQRVRKKTNVLVTPNDLSLGEPNEASVVFVREPYSRLFSGYVDKLFFPSTIFWKMTGGKVVRHFRQNATSPIGRRCGHDVTFAEFVNYFTHLQRSGKGVDAHFRPMHRCCSWCRYPYRYIGHVETLKEDLPFILKAIRSPVTYNESYGTYPIITHASVMLNRMRSAVQRCMGLDEACRRFWKVLQIRGFISKDQPFPLTRKQTRSITAKQLIRTALEARGRSGDRKALAAQRTEALKEAFAGIALEERRQLQDVFFLDFEMFGFDPAPEEVFPTAAVDSEVPHSDIDFSYFDLYR